MPTSQVAGIIGMSHPIQPKPAADFKQKIFDG
jgi:hypothetical protein